MTFVGELRVTVRMNAGVICGVHVASSRPDVARTLLSGRPVRAVQAAIPTLFAVCGTSQSVACNLALAAACGHDPAPTLATAASSVALETLCETACQVLLRWPTWLDERPSPSAVSTARTLMLHGLAHKAPQASVLQACAQAVFGCSASTWLALPGWDDVLQWAAHGGTPAARTLASLQRAEDASARPQATVPLLPPASAALVLPLASLALSDPGFCARPTWVGHAAETGARARLRHDALLHQRAGRPANRPAQRVAARLRELAALLATPQESTAGCAVLASGVGVGWVDNVRGLLLHVAHVRGDRVVDYRIVAPTEWNLHPQGAVACDLLDTPVRDAAAALARATRSVHSLDPCAAFSVEACDA